MNIFVIDSRPDRAAKNLIDYHVLKMGIEGGQILCAAAARLGVSGLSLPYKPTHLHSPPVEWVLKGHAGWLFEHVYEIGMEYRRRFGKTHAIVKHLDQFNTLKEFIRSRVPEVAEPTVGGHTLLRSVPPWFHTYNGNGSLQTIASYRNYYGNVKATKSLNYRSGCINGYRNSINGRPGFVDQILTADDSWKTRVVFEEKGIDQWYSLMGEVPMLTGGRIPSRNRDIMTTYLFDDIGEIHVTRDGSDLLLSYRHRRDGRELSLIRK